MLSPLIEVRQADVILSGHRILHGVSLTIQAGERVALMGANGSGKSTLIRTLCGLNPVSAGQVRLFGQSMSRRTDWGQIGWVPQQPSPGLDLGTVTEIVASGRIAHRRIGRRSTPADHTAVATAMAVAGIEPLADRCFGHLSGGQRQRVLIARALATNPSVLLLDEPMTGVDVANQYAIAHTLDQLAANGVTLCAVVHGTGPLTDLLTRAVVLENGHVVRDAPGIPTAIPDAGAHDHRHDHPNDHPFGYRHRQQGYNREAHDPSPGTQRVDCP